jgi:DNA-binding FrmR family transcriptional regulator
MIRSLQIRTDLEAGIRFRGVAPQEEQRSPIDTGARGLSAQGGLAIERRSWVTIYGWGYMMWIRGPIFRPRTNAKETAMQLPEEVIEDIRKRLHRVGGQIEGIERMLDEGRECRDVVTQISAANKALEQAGFRLVAAGLTYCLANPEEAESDGYPLETVQKMFMKLA